MGTYFCNEYGYILSQSFLNEELQNVLIEIHIEQPHLIDKEVSVESSQFYVHFEEVVLLGIDGNYPFYITTK